VLRKNKELLCHNGSILLTILSGVEGLLNASLRAQIRPCKKAGLRYSVFWQNREKNGIGLVLVKNVRTKVRIIVWLTPML
jgi:hypothetical protein